MRFIVAAFSYLKRHFRKILFLLASIVVWTFLIFPFGDLSDLIGSQIAEMTKDTAKVFLQFSNLQISLFPPGIRLIDATIDTAFTGTLDAQEFNIYPSLFSLFGAIPYGSIDAVGVMKGNLEISLKSGSKSESGTERQRLEIHAEHLSLQDLGDVTQLPVKMKGSLSADTTALADLTFVEQPDTDIVIKTEKFELPSQTFNSYMGPVSIPDLKTSSLDMKAHMAGGKMVIDEGIIGKDGDDIHGSIKGKIGLVLSNKMGFQTQVTDYNLDLDLLVKSSLESPLSVPLALFTPFRIAAGDYGRYRVNLNGQNTFSPPTITPLH